MFSSKMRFTLLSSSDMQRLSHVHVVNKALYLQDNSREPALYGVLDRRMVSSVDQGLIYVVMQTLYYMCRDLISMMENVKVKVEYY